MGRHRLAFFAIAASLLSGCQPEVEVRQVDTLRPPVPLDATDGSYLDLGVYYLRTGDYERARRSFTRSLRTEGNSVAALAGVGVSFERQGLLSEAHRYFERAKELNPDSIMVRNNLGTVYYRMGDYISAQKEFQAAFAMSSGRNDVAAYNLALSEQARLAKDAKNLPIAPNTHQLQREGLGEYRLFEAKKPATTDDGAGHAG